MRTSDPTGGLSVPRAMEPGNVRQWPAPYVAAVQEDGTKANRESGPQGYMLQNCAARCCRQPEFSQLDMEMTFMDQDAIMGLVEGLVAHVFQQVGSPI